MTAFAHDRQERGRIAELEAENMRLRKALVGVLAHERRRAKLNGYSDCGCINFSRDTERAYERGECPHQRARAIMGESDDG